ncbi:hypothetical protein SULI_00885 [Saccharolobus solfataricus]|uniref:Uncharacterized protein n=3 Tax=Saccharolobus solfataricus TaxID=2287 RepID=Q97W67_SACS2|nr:hypothetical protein [Saccharolobus solfataricus]AAK42521.1 Hypothetical protein SSO2370 [Saccharolobus solfataricus P2]AKA72618.1 hypothetical protein SULB_0175 [Saccharolobus solfataricus]AKA75317.1 hypothetical protein SULC_0174 [Saccharolobus solfataricus]AKA78010.1 hypothetical protein SULA_0174 [Saccharolobus solfataricus]AZF67129.1 hypothetical protein SULG_00885 [Saccharolobus solfataricus]
MSTEIDSKNSSIDMFTTYEEELRVGEALAHILAAASIVLELEGESEEVRNTIMKYIDLWISKLSPIDYSPGMAEVIGSKVRRKITSVFNEISENELGDILDFIIDVKRKLDIGTLETEILELEVKVERILRVLGIDINDVKQFFDFTNLEKRANRLIALATVSIGIASVWDEKWTVELQ